MNRWRSGRGPAALLAAMVIALLGGPAAAQTCKADVDCEGDAICVRGACTDPNAPDDSGVQVRYSDGDEGAADGVRLPVRYVERPIVLPHLVLRPEAELSILRLNVFEGQTFVGLALGASIGLFDALELSLFPIVFSVAPDVAYGDIPLVARYRFLDGPIELGAELFLRIPTDTNFAIAPALLVRFHAGDFMAIDTGVRLSVTFPDPDPVVGLSVPLELSFQIVDMFFAGVDTGLGIFNFDAPGDTFFLPFGLRAGFTLPSDSGPLFDIIAGFAFPLFLVPGADDKVITDLYVFSLNFAFHLFL